MNARELERFRKLLLELKRKLTSNIDHLQNDALKSAGEKVDELSDIPAEHMAERGSDNFARDLMIRILQDSDAELCDINLSLEKIEADFKQGDRIEIDLGGYSDEFAGNPVPINGTIELLGTYRNETAAVLNFGANNRVILTQHLTQVTTPSIFKPLNIPLEELDIIVLKSRVHFRRGFHETELAGAIFEVDAPGLGPADLTVLPYKNIPKDIYPVYSKQ